MSASTGIVTAVVCEDEAPQRQALVQLLREEWPQLRVAAECADGLESLEALQRHEPDVALLDIRMPGVSGLVVAARAAPHTHVIFTTAYSEHAVTAFEHGAVDYLLKPVSRERLRTALDRVQRRIASGERSDAAMALARLREHDAGMPPRALHWISASVGTAIRMIPLQEILFFQASDKYTRVVHGSGEAVIRTPLKELLATLDGEEFWQVHRSVIVRVAAVRSMKHLGGEKYELEIADSAERLPVSAAFKGRFRRM